VAIVGETFAARAWPGAEPIGRQIEIETSGGDPRPRSEMVTIIGVSGKVLRSAMHDRELPRIYLPFAQFPAREVTVVVRTRGVPDLQIAPVKQVLRETIPDVMMEQVTTLTADVAEFLRPTHLYARLLAVFALLAIALAVSGVYASMSYSVRQRSREMAIRLGAPRSSAPHPRRRPARGGVGRGDRGVPP
jgi:hypothetical protein